MGRFLPPAVMLTMAMQVGLGEDAALQRLTAAGPALVRWLATYIQPAPGAGAMLDVGYGSGGPPQQPMCIQVGHGQKHRFIAPVRWLPT